MSPKLKRSLIYGGSWVFAAAVTFGIILLFASGGCSTIFGGGDSEIEIYEILKPGDRVEIGAVNTVVGRFPLIVAYIYHENEGTLSQGTWHMHDPSTGEISLNVPPVGKGWILVLRR